jgi:hypothetical protein
MLPVAVHSRLYGNVGIKHLVGEHVQHPLGSLAARPHLELRQ